jgi:hypothetical protein
LCSSPASSISGVLRPPTRPGNAARQRLSIGVQHTSFGDQSAHQPRPSIGVRDNVTGWPIGRMWRASALGTSWAMPRCCTCASFEHLVDRIDRAAGDAGARRSFGDQTDEVLAEFGFTADEIDAKIMRYDHKSRTVGENLGPWPRRSSLIYATAAILAFAILGIQQHSEFIYFRF